MRLERDILSGIRKRKEWNKKVQEALLRKYYIKQMIFTDQQKILMKFLKSNMVGSINVWSLKYFWKISKNAKNSKLIFFFLSLLRPLCIYLDNKEVHWEKRFFFLLEIIVWLVLYFGTFRIIGSFPDKSSVQRRQVSDQIMANVFSLFCTTIA